MMNREEIKQELNEIIERLNMRSEDFYEWWIKEYNPKTKLSSQYAEAIMIGWARASLELLEMKV